MGALRLHNFLKIHATSETFMASDFPVTVLQATGSGTYSGYGFVEVPYLADTKLKVVFNNITLNTDKQLIAGVVETTYDPKEKNIVGTEDVIDEVRALGDLFKEVFKLLGDSKKNLDDIDQLIADCKKGKIKEDECREKYKEKVDLAQKQYEEIEQKSKDLPEDVQKELEGIKPAVVLLASTSYVAWGDDSPKNLREIKKGYEKISIEAKFWQEIDQEFGVGNKEFDDFIKKLQKVSTYFKNCNNQDSWASYKDRGIVPECFWKNDKTEIPFTINDAPFVAGLIDGGYQEAKGIVDLSVGAAKLLDAYITSGIPCTKLEQTKSFAQRKAEVRKRLVLLYGEDSFIGKTLQIPIAKVELNYIQHCEQAKKLRADTKATLTELYEMVNSWEEVKTLYDEVKKDFTNYLSEVSKLDNKGRYEIGTLVVPVGTIFIPAVGQASKMGRTKELLKGIKGLSKVKKKELFEEIVKKSGGKVDVFVPSKLSNKLTGSLKEIFDKLYKAGYKISDDGTTILFKNANDLPIAKISDDALHIKIPNNHGGGGWARQSNTPNALNALNKTNTGEPLYRIGTLNRSTASEAQYWSLENPLDVKNINEFSQKYGIPKENLKTGEFFVEIGKPKQDIPRISREAPGVGGNTGGSIEIVVPVNGVKLESFHTIKF
jgi:hypothetical protein